MTDRLSALLPAFDVISFDVFDTLLLRPYLTQEDLWLDLGRRELGEKGGAAFLEARIAADRATYAAATKRGGEHTIDEAYEMMPRSYARLQAKEEVLQRECLVANPEMLEVWKRAGELGKKRIVVSDMYLGEAWFAATLKENGFGDYDALYVSSARQARKSSGKLFEIVKKDFAGKQILHIGDNRASDVDMAVKSGLVARQYVKVAEKTFVELPFLRTFVSENPSFEKRHLCGTLALGWHCFKAEHPGWTYWNRLGFFFAGTLGYSYIRFCGESAQERGINHFMMVARDCYILEKICNLLYPEIKTDYFYASRLSALFATQYYGHKPNDIRKRRRLVVRHLRERFGVVLTSDEEDLFFSAGQLPSSAQRVMDEIADKERKQTEDYFSQFGIERKSSAIIDGTSGNFTVQRFVSNIVGFPVFTYYLLTMLPVENAETMYYSPKSDMRYLGFSEFLFGAPTPPVDKIENGKPIFKTDVGFYEKFKIEVCEDITEGAVECAKWLKKCCANVAPLVWLDLNDAFMDNQSVEDREQMSFAMDSVAPGHEGEYFRVINEDRASETRYCLFGKTMLVERTVRVGEEYRRLGCLFGLKRLNMPRLFLRLVHLMARIGRRLV